MRKKLDKELIIALASLSLLFSIGIIFFLIFIFDINISEHLTGIVGSYSSLSGGIWLFLLCRNC
ncbi:MAG: hypothetical protein IJR96_10190 [Pseudobutyrivibrio sp.]|nr:hypothetical protein [Pseudobutyrivibrio sp.]